MRALVRTDDFTPRVSYPNTGTIAMQALRIATPGKTQTKLALAFARTTIMVMPITKSIAGFVIVLALFAAPVRARHFYTRVSACCRPTPPIKRKHIAENSALGRTDVRGAHVMLARFLVPTVDFQQPGQCGSMEFCLWCFCPRPPEVSNALYCPRTAQNTTHTRWFLLALPGVCQTPG